MSLEERIPFGLRAWLKEHFHATLLQDPVRIYKYLPARLRQNSYVTRSSASMNLASDDLPIPPRELQLMYGPDDAAYIEGGVRHHRSIMRAVSATGLLLNKGDRILDFGCGAGRILRQFAPQASDIEAWGVDINADSILWCKTNLTPPFRFLTSTTIPHLPFEDRTFRLIYAASVFAHIEDTAEAWLMELQRILHPDGRLFITIHDERSIELLETTYASSRLTKLIAGYQAWRERGTDFDQIVIGRDRRSSIFYRRDFFIRHVAPAWDIVSVIPDCHDYQTGLVLARPDRQGYPGTQDPTVTATIDQEQAEELPR